MSLCRRTSLAEVVRGLGEPRVDELLDGHPESPATDQQVLLLAQAPGLIPSKPNTCPVTESSGPSSGSSTGCSSVGALGSGLASRGSTVRRSETDREAPPQEGRGRGEGEPGHQWCPCR